MLSVSWRNNFRVSKGADVLSITVGCKQARTHEHTIQVSAYITFKDKTANIARTVVEHSVLIVFSQEGHTVVLSRPPVMCDISEKGWYNRTGRLAAGDTCSNAFMSTKRRHTDTTLFKPASASQLSLPPVLFCIPYLTYIHIQKAKKCRITKTLLLWTGYNISEGQYNSTLTVKVSMEYMSIVEDRKEGKGFLKRLIIRRVIIFVIV